MLALFYITDEKKSLLRFTSVHYDRQGRTSSSYTPLAIFLAISWLFVAFFLSLPGRTLAENTLLARGDNNYPPYEYLDSKSAPDGFNVEVLRAVAEVMGLSVSIKLGPWNEVRSDLEQGRIDIITGMYYSALRAKKVDFTSPHVVVTYALFVRDDSEIESLENAEEKRILVQKGDYGDDYITNRGLGREIVRVENPAAALRLLASGRYDCAVLPRVLGLYVLQDFHLKNLKTAGPPILPRNYCFAVKKGDQQLVNALNEGLAIIKNTGEYDKIYQKWFGPVEERHIREEILKRLATMLLPFLLLLVLALIWLASLKIQVRRKTRELVRELTERKAAEKSLLESEEKYRRLFELESDAIFLIDKETAGILEVNDAACRLYGYSRQELLSLDLTAISAEPEKSLQASRESHDHIPLRYHKAKDDHIFPVEITVSHFNWKGRYVHLSAVRDISDRLAADKQRSLLESQLRQAKKMEALGTFAGGIAHDFNNILAAIIGYTELAISDIDEGLPSSESLEEILNSAERARDLVKRILTFSRRVEPSLAPMDVNHEISEAVKMVERAIPRMIEIRLDLSTKPLVTRGDPSQFEQIVLNLASNAKDAMPDGGVFSIKTSRMDVGFDGAPPFVDLPPGEYICMVAEDNGLGINPETMEHIFDPFYTTKPLGSGTGLGLSTIYGIVKSHRGHITCESEPGLGTRFTILLPRLRGANVDKPKESGEDRDNLTGDESLLLVDDEESIRQIGQQILARFGYRVTTASTGEQALEILKDHPHQLVILDISMPGMGGIKCFELIRDMAPDTRIIIASGYFNTSDLDEITDLNMLMDSGLAAYLPKPFNHQKLIRTIREMLGDRLSKK